MKRMWKHVHGFFSFLPIIFAAIFIAIFILYASPSRGALRTSEAYYIESDVLSSGGTYESSSNYMNLDPLGQTAVGSSESENYESYGGFLENINTSPETPTSLAQYRSDGVTSISTGEWIGISPVVLKFNMYDQDASDVLTPQVELRPTSESFTGGVTDTGADVNFGGATVEGIVTVEGFTNLVGYHWQAMVRDSGGLTSPWDSFGGNAEEEIDFKVDAVTPEVPTTLEAIALPSSSPTYVSLSWNAATDEAPGSGFAGYNLYRSPTSGEGYSKINTETLTSTTTTDTTVSTGEAYYYVVTSKDNAGNESDYSNESSAPNLIIDKIMTIEAPTSGGYGGNADDAVPGSTIIYTIGYSNSGFAPAAGLVIVDKIPEYTDYKIESATGEAATSILFSDDNGGSYNYTPTGEAVDSAVTNIEWSCGDLQAGGNSNVQFKVIIK